MTERGGKRCKQLLNDLKEMRGYWKLRESIGSHSVDNSL
jgi:hypothetical protein